MDLPSPIEPAKKAGDSAAVDKQEKIVANPESASKPKQSMPPTAGAQAAQTPQPPTVSATTQQAQQDDPVLSGMPQIADDVDLIEKEWVEKAKQIVEQTKDDPGAQNEAMSRVKAAYQKRRFNRDAVVSKGK